MNGYIPQHLEIQIEMGREDPGKARSEEILKNSHIKEHPMPRVAICYYLTDPED